MKQMKPLTRDEISLMVAAAQLCYQKEMTQEEVAEVLNISRPKVSRLLSQARKNGIVEIKIRNPIARNTDVQNALIKSFGLADAIVTPITVDRQEVIVPQIAQAAASYINANLPENAVLGLGRGYTIYETVGYLSPGTQQPVVLPLSGGLGEGEAGFPITEIITRTASALNGKSKFIYAPALVASKKFRDSVLTEPHSLEVVQLWDKMDWVVLGIGAIPSLRQLADPDYHRSLRAFVQEVKQQPVSDLCLWFVLPDGTIPKTSKDICLIAATPEQIGKAKVRLAVAGGTAKARAIFAVLRTGLINVLVTDERTAEELVTMKEAMPD